MRLYGHMGTGALCWAFGNPSNWHTAGKQGFVQKKQLNSVLTWSSWKYSGVSVQMEYTKLPTAWRRAVNSTANNGQQSNEQYCQLCATEQWTVLSNMRKRAMNSTTNCAQQTSENYCQLCATEQCQQWATEQWIVLPNVRNRAMNSTAKCARQSHEQ